MKLLLNPFKKITLLILAGSVFAFSQKAMQEEDAFYVYSDKWENGIPTGFMGEKNGISLKLDDACKDNPYKGEKCIRFAVDNSESWRGIHIQYTGGWNISVEPTTQLPDLSAYDKLEFYARAEGKDGGIYVLEDIGVGGGGGFEDKKSDSFIEIGKEWKKYTLNLKGMDLKRINTLMYMVLPQGTLYLDEIRFIKKKKK
jgi:hypothetical protein